MAEIEDYQSDYASAGVAGIIKEELAGEECSRDCHRDVAEGVKDIQKACFAGAGAQRSTFRCKRVSTDETKDHDFE